MPSTQPGCIGTGILSCCSMFHYVSAVEIKGVALAVSLHIQAQRHFCSDSACCRLAVVHFTCLSAAKQ